MTEKVNQPKAEILYRMQCPLCHQSVRVRKDVTGFTYLDRHTQRSRPLLCQRSFDPAPPYRVTTDSAQMTDAFVRKFCRLFVRGMCGTRSTRDWCYMVSAPLQALLQGMGRECKLVGGSYHTDDGRHSHTWIEFPDGRIIDATADQFGRKRVYLEVPSGRYRRTKERPAGPAQSQRSGPAEAR